MTGYHKLLHQLVFVSQRKHAEESTGDPETVVSAGKILQNILSYFRPPSVCILYSLISFDGNAIDTIVIELMR